MDKTISKAFNKLFFKSYVHLFFELNRFKDNISPDKSILIFSNPRGGSTWLAELFKTIDNSLLIWEPLKRYKLSVFNKLGFYWHQPIPESEIWPEAYSAFKKLLNLEISSQTLYVHNNTLSIPFSRNYIFKFCFGNMLLPWVVQNFNVNPILLTRHPCAVVSSQMKHESWDGIKGGHISYEIEEFRYNDEYLKYKNILKHIKTQEEHLAATWSFTTVNTIMHPQNDIKWITVSYESLYQNFDEEINRIFGRLGIPIPEKIYDAKLNPSKTTKTDSVDKIHTGDQLHQWKKTLSKKQIENILGITREFGITFYDDSPEPDYSQIYKSGF